MKKTGYWKGFASALVLTALVAALGITATATYQRTIQVEDGIGITLNGAKFTPRDVSGKEVPVFLYNGTTYAPVRAVCEAAGMEVSYNSATDTVVLTTMEQAASEGGLRQLHRREPGQRNRPERRWREGVQRRIPEGSSGLGRRPGRVRGGVLQRQRGVRL